MNIINLTPHPIHIGDVTIPRSGRIARAESVVTPAEPIDGIPTGVETFGAVDLPEPAADTWLIVSTIAAQAAARSGRTVADLLVPGAPIRDSSGAIIGCAALMRQGSDD